MLHDYLESRDVRGQCEISFVLPLSTPVPPSPETSKALVAAFAERNIKFHPSKRVVKIDAARKMASLDDNSEMAFDLCPWECPSIVYPPWFWIVASRKMVG